MLVKLEPQALNDLSARLTSNSMWLPSKSQISNLSKKKGVSKPSVERRALTYINSSTLSEMTSNDSGYWIPETQHALGQYIGQGTTLGYVFQPENMALARSLLKILSFLMGSPSKCCVSLIVRSIHQIVYESIQGSRIITYPRLTVDGGDRLHTSGCTRRLVSVRPYNLWIKLPFATNHLHERVQIQFTLQSEPVAYRIYRAVRRTFLSWFGF